MIDTPLQSILHAVLSFVRHYPSLMNLDLRNVFSDPRQVFADRGIPSVIFAILHDETGNSMHGPRIIAVSAHQRTTGISSASVGICDLSKSNTHNFVVVFAASGVDDRHTGLHQSVGDTSTRVTGHSPTSNIATLCSDRRRRFGHASENHPRVELEGTVNFNQGVVSKQSPGAVRGVHDNSLHHTNLLGGFPVHPDVCPHHNSITTWIVFGNRAHTVTGC